MKCPFCQYDEDRVIDSRLSKDGSAIRRRRECLGCGKRFTTYEVVEDVMPMVVKKDGRREPFDRMKIKMGLMKACEKRPISVDEIEGIVERVERACQGTPGREVSTSFIGERVMEELRHLDGVAYVRFASVYREFRDVSDFMEELKDLLKRKRG
ncbi:MAG TPA: transcriptional regulator NrdR [Syntrophales bacterium]|nr:transcriptional regulator NrdR [Syntrophales bacterium]HOL58739.1 transcriptional regulator NrdR [Syntrophales bacterium]HPO34973.1 transcriptional regulator NrdR [Syntrophales bacterium]